jgi:hypothetical protein
MDAMQVALKIAVVAFVLATFLFIIYWIWSELMIFRDWLRHIFGISGQQNTVVYQQTYNDYDEDGREIRHYNALPMASGREHEVPLSRHQGRENTRLRARSAGHNRRVRQRPPIPGQYSDRRH